MERILIVEDDTDINSVIASFLSKRGYACIQAYSGTEACLVLDQAHFDLVICDLMLPGMMGEDVIARIRKRDQNLPVIVLSARSSASDKIDVLGLGADDYLSKPFDLAELLARIEVQFRHRHRHETAEEERHEVAVLGRWRLDSAARSLVVDECPIRLTNIEFNVIELLVRNPRRVFTKQELFELAWGEPYAVEDNTVTTHISNIRRKLKATGTDSYIKTVWGLGFKLDVQDNL